MDDKKGHDATTSPISFALLCLSGHSLFVTWGPDQDARKAKHWQASKTHFTVGRAAAIPRPGWPGL